MKISIITVCYNSALTIGDTITSVASQSYADKEHILVDGNSSDATMDMVRASSSISRFVSEPDKGVYDAMNKGIALATGDVIGFLNSDDFYVDDSVLAQVAEVFTNTEVDACYADLIYVDKKDTNKIVRYWKSRTFVPGLFERGWMPAHPTFFVRRQVYEELGGFDLSYRIQADFELTMRFLEVYRVKSMHLPKIFIKMRVGGISNNSVVNIIKGNIEAYKACKKNHLSISFLFNIKKIVSRVPQFFVRPASF